MPDLNVMMQRTGTKRGDMVIRINTGGAIGGAISAMSGSEFVHGGLAIGGNEIVEVNGGLNPDSTGKGRILANIYKTNITTDLKDNDYVVYRCNDTDLATQVAIEASPFVASGSNSSWGYNLTGAVSSLMSPSVTTGQFLYIDENESVLSVARRENRNFFCTEWMVWVYQKTAEKMRKPLRIGIAPKDAFPGALVTALDKSSSFTYVGAIRNVTSSSALLPKGSTPRRYGT